MIRGIPLWMLLAGCAGRHAYYEPVSFSVQSAPAGSEYIFPQMLADDLRRGRLRSLSVAPAEGAEPEPIASEDLQDLPAELLYAAIIASPRWARGAELDLLVGRPDDLSPVTVWHSVDREMVLVRGTRAPEPHPVPAHGDVGRWARQLARDYDLASIEGVDQPWTLDELGDVATSLTLLQPAERLALEGFALGRMKVSPRRPKVELGFYDPTASPERIDFFDAAFESTGSAFIGSVSDPVRPAVMTILHEIGHAFSDWPIHEAHARWVGLQTEHLADPDNRALAAEAKDAARIWHRMGFDGPVISRYRTLRARRPGPTSYGRATHESFAEAFALFHADPAALKRTLPEVHDWFAADGHLDWRAPDPGRR